MLAAYFIQNVQGNLKSELNIYVDLINNPTINEIFVNIYGFMVGEISFSLQKAQDAMFNLICRLNRAASNNRLAFV